MPIKIKSTSGGSVTIDVPSTAVDSTMILPTTNAGLVSNTNPVMTGNVAISGANSYININGSNVSPFGGVRNKVINGAMMIDQRYVGTANTIAATSTIRYVVDRFRFVNSTDAVITVQQSSVAPTGFANSLSATVATADTSIGAGQRFLIDHHIEGYNVVDLMFGTSSAQPVTVSFWVRSSVTGTYCVSLMNNDSNRCYVSAYSINAANTWEQKIITVPGCTDGTWYTNNSRGLTIDFGLAVGSNYQTTADSWSTVTDATSTSAQVNWVNTIGNTFYITGIQLERGTVATPFEWRSYGHELALCQRYYWEASGVSAGYSIDGLYAASSGNGLVCSWPHPVVMRSAPTSLSNYNDLTNAGTPSLTTSATGFRVATTTTGSGRTAMLFTASGYVKMNSEL